MRVTLQLRHTLPYIIILASLVGLFASTILAYDQAQIWQNPDYNAPCNLNPVISCGSVINSGEGHVFGIPAPFLGLVSFPALAMVGVTMLAGAKLKRWFWLGLQLFLFGGVAFALWLFWLSLYRIHALCPYCLTTDVAMYTLAWYVTVFNIQQGYLLSSARYKRIASFITKHHLDILLVVLVAIAIYTLHHFWYYYGRYF